MMFDGDEMDNGMGGDEAAVPTMPTEGEETMTDGGMADESTEGGM